VGNCCLAIVRPTELSAGECLELNEVAATLSCPVPLDKARSVRFDLTARTPRTNLRWRVSPNSIDVLEPSSGSVASNGKTSVVVTDVVKDDLVAIDIVDGDKILLKFRLRHN